MSFYRSCKTACPSVIIVRANMAGQKLVVCRIESSHNHVLAYRQQNICPVMPARWCQEAHTSPAATSVTTRQMPCQSTTVLSETQKYHTAHPVVMNILQVLVHSSTTTFRSRLQQLQFLSDQWTEDNDVITQSKKLLVLRISFFCFLTVTYSIGLREINRNFVPTTVEQQKRNI